MKPPTLVACGRTIPLDRPLVMGVVNATPDSFSDAGLRRTAAEQIEHGLQLVGEGADILDVGGLSAVTGQPAVEVHEEIERVLPVIAGLRDAGVELISVDTWRADVAAAAVSAGATIVNDISGLRDPDLARVCGDSGAALVLMHTEARPKVRTVDLTYADLPAAICRFLEDRLERANAAGVRLEQTILDPGPDFSKSPPQTVEALRALPDLVALGRPVLLAVSRKDFIGALTGRRPRQRLSGTLAAIGHGLASGAAIVRVHDVAATVDFLKVRAALEGEVPIATDLRLPDELRREPRPAAAD